MKASIVTGLAFGDEGKGITTDYLCSRWDTDKTLVIRHCGGQQAGHTVMLNKIKHVHSNFGSGTLRGVPSYISEHCCIYPHTIKAELEILRSKGIEPKLYVHPLAKLTTPLDVHLGRQWERKNHHGSCGIGVGAAMKRHYQLNHKIYAMDIKYPEVLRTKILMLQLGHGFFSQEIKEEIDQFIETCKQIPIEFWDYHELGDRMDKYEHVIFEGAQGILLDMDHGFFPHVTYANTTSKNALEICAGFSLRPDIYYVTRCYGTRHGRGWMPDPAELKLQNTEEEINVYNDWQGSLRYYEFDLELLNYALDADAQYVTDYSTRNIVVTCLDQRPDFDLKLLKKLHGPFSQRLGSYSPYSKDFKSLFHELK